MQFKNERAEVHLVDLTDSFEGIPLCSGHARTRTAPVGWSLVDRRTPTHPDGWESEAPSVAVTPGARPPRRRSSDHGFEFGRQKEPIPSQKALDAASPLLARAFRVVPN